MYDSRDQKSERAESRLISHQKSQKQHPSVMITNLPTTYTKQALEHLLQAYIPFDFCINSQNYSYLHEKELSMNVHLENNINRVSFVQSLNRQKILFVSQILLFELLEGDESRQEEEMMQGASKEQLKQYKRTICILGLPKMMNEDDIKGIFISFGKIEEVVLKQKIDKKKNFCFLIYSSEFSARKALKVSKVRSKKYRTSLKINKFYGKIPQCVDDYDDDDNEEEEEEEYIKKSDYAKIIVNQPDKDNEGSNSLKNEQSRFNNFADNQEEVKKIKFQNHKNQGQKNQLSSFSKNMGIPMTMKQYPSINISDEQFHFFPNPPEEIKKFLEGPFYKVKRVTCEHQFYEEEKTLVQLILLISKSKGFSKNHQSPVNLKLTKKFTMNFG